MPACEDTILSWVKGQGGSATISDAHSHAVAKVGENFTKSIEAENRGRFFHRNLGYVMACFAMTIAVIVGVIVFGGLQEQDIKIMAGIAFACFFAGIVGDADPSCFFSFNFQSLVRSITSLAFLAVFVPFMASMLQDLFPHGPGETLLTLWSYVENYPFAFVLVGAFATVNGMFLHLMRAPTALGRPIMDQLAGFRLYLETAESDRLNLSAPEITADRFETLLPYAVALDVEKPWSDAFAAAVRRVHPDDPDPMSSYQPRWSSGGWSGSNFSNAVSSSVASMSEAFASAEPASSGSSGFSGGGGGSGGRGGGGGGW